MGVVHLRCYQIMCCIAEFTRCCAPSQAVRLRWELEHSSGTATVKLKNTTQNVLHLLTCQSVYSYKVILNILCSYILVPLLFSLASQYCQTSLWIVFLEEETNVNLHNLLQVLSKFKTRKVSCRLFSLSAVVTAKVQYQDFTPWLLWLSYSDNLCIWIRKTKRACHWLRWLTDNKSCHWDWVCKSPRKHPKSVVLVYFLDQKYFSLCGHPALEILCHFNFRHPIISSCEEAFRGLSSN